MTRNNFYWRATGTPYNRVGKDNNRLFRHAVPLQHSGFYFFQMLI